MSREARAEGRGCHHSLIVPCLRCVPDTRMEPGSLNTSAAVWPPLDMRGVAQPVPSTKDAVVIAFILLLWLYSIVLTARAYSKLLSDGRAAAESDMQIVDWWR